MYHSIWDVGGTVGCFSLFHRVVTFPSLSHFLLVCLLTKENNCFRTLNRVTFYTKFGLNAFYYSDFKISLYIFFILILSNMASFHIYQYLWLNNLLYIFSFWPFTPYTSNRNGVLNKLLLIKKSIIFSLRNI